MNILISGKNVRLKTNENTVSAINITRQIKVLSTVRVVTG